MESQPRVLNAAHMMVKQKNTIHVKDKRCIWDMNPNLKFHSKKGNKLANVLAFSFNMALFWGTNSVIFGTGYDLDQPSLNTAYGFYYISIMNGIGLLLVFSFF